jgi:hypothetical protein
MGQVADWSSRQVHYPRGTSLAALALSQRDPRAYWNYLNLVNKVNAALIANRTRVGQPPIRRPRHIIREIDWSVPLGPAGTAANQYPAKYSYDVNATPDCTNDFVVFSINTAPTAAQANIAAFNNLYSGSSPAGICSGTTANVYWAYQVGASRVATSPAVSLDGTKVAFVENSNPAVFHVLTWTANTGSVFAPATPATISDVTLTGGTTDPDSSPFIDYYGDAAYVGTNNGDLFKISGVFKGTPALAGAPWPITGLGAALTSPVVDFKTGNIFVADSAGRLYGFTSAGAAITGSPATIGSGRAHGGIADPPLVDALNGLLYVVTGEDSTRTSAIVAQLSTSNISSMVTAAIGLNNITNIHSPAFNEPYYSGNANMPGTTQEWFLYACGLANGPIVTSPVLYRVGFTGTLPAPPVMNSAVDATTVSLSNNNAEQCSPLTEFANGVDRLFIGLRTSAFVESFDISSSTTPALGPQVSEAGGTSGIVVDNASGDAQASSIYFTNEANSAACRTTINHRCGVKLTQSGLN